MAKWWIVPAIADHHLASIGYKLASEHRDGSALTTQEFAELRAINEVFKPAPAVEKRESDLLARCPFAVVVSPLDLDVAEETPGYDPTTAPGVAASMARRLTTLAVELGLGEPTWHLTNVRGGLHGDLPDMPREVTSPLLPRAIGEALRAACEREGIPCSEPASAPHEDRTHPVILDLGNFNRSTTGKGAMRRFVGTRKEDAGSVPKAPVARFLAERPELAPLGPSSAPARPDAAKILAMIAECARRDALRPALAPPEQGTAVLPEGVAALQEVARAFLAHTGAGARHRARLALCGWLAREGVSETLLAGTVALIAPDDLEVVPTTLRRAAAGLPVAGYQALQRIVGDRGMDALRAALESSGVLIGAAARVVERRLVVTRPRSSWTPKLTAAEDAVYLAALSHLPDPTEEYAGDFRMETVYPPGYRALDDARECRWGHTAPDCDDHGAKGIVPWLCNRRFTCLNCDRLRSERAARELAETWEAAGLTHVGVMKLEVPDSTDPADLVRAVRALERSVPKFSPKGGRARTTVKGYDHVLAAYDPRTPEVDEAALRAERDLAPVTRLEKFRRKQDRRRLSDFDAAKKDAAAAGLPVTEDSARVVPLAEFVELHRRTQLSFSDAFQQHLAAGDHAAMAAFPWLYARGVHLPCQNRAATERMPLPSERVMGPKRRAAALEKRHGVPFSECETQTGVAEGKPCYCRKELNQSAVSDRSGRVLATRRGRPFWGPEVLRLLQGDRVTVGAHARL